MFDILSNFCKEFSIFIILTKIIIFYAIQLQDSEF